MNCEPYQSTSLGQTCQSTIFSPDFRDWEIMLDCAGVETIMVGFGYTATGPVPSTTTCPRIVFHPMFTDKSLGRDNCGGVINMVGFGPTMGASNLLALVQQILADPAAKCALVNGLILAKTSNTIKAVTLASGVCGLAENDAITNWELAS
jgi:hypothetical protein